MRRLAPGLVLLLLAGALAGCTAPATRSDPPPNEPVQPAAESPPSGGPDQPPTASFDWYPQQPATGETVSFRDRSSDPDDGVAGRVWVFGDGGTSRMANATHVYLAPGTYTVTLLVSDRAGVTANATRAITILPGATTTVRYGPRPHVTIALVDTGINPYHQVFALASAQASPATFLDGYPLDARPLNLSLGVPYDQAVKTDDAAWKGVQTKQLYYVPGTRIVGAISFGNSTFGNAAPNKTPILDDDGHGTATSSTVALNAPDVSIVMVESGADELDEAVAWASSQPWIDIVSISIGPLLNSPLPQELDAQTAGYEPPTKLAWARGAMVFAAAGNDPSLSATGYLAGPSWVVSVGGAYPGSSSDPGTSSKAMDVVSDYGPKVAKRDSVDGTQVEHGTSFSCPAAAGAVGQALYWLRARAGDVHGIQQGRLLAVNGPGLLADGLTNAELRTAMNGVAQYWDTTSWGAADGIPEVAPWAQMGWGYLDGKDAQRLADAAWSGQVPEKPAEAQAYMGAVMAARIALWP